MAPRKRSACASTELFEALRDQVAAQTARLLQTAEVLAWLDVLASLAELAAERNYCRPNHPRRAGAAHRGRPASRPGPDHCRPAPSCPTARALGPDDGYFLLITGPNMGGKSIFISQAALLDIDGPDRQLCAGPRGQDRPRRPHFHPRRRQRRIEPGPEHVHGGDDRSGQHPEQRHACAAWSSSTRSAAAPAPTTASRWPGASPNSSTTASVAAPSLPPTTTSWPNWPSA